MCQVKSSSLSLAALHNPLLYSKTITHSLSTLVTSVTWKLFEFILDPVIKQYWSKLLKYSSGLVVFCNFVSSTVTFNSHITLYEVSTTIASIIVGATNLLIYIKSLTLMCQLIL
jgi:hypothetical protein